MKRQDVVIGDLLTTDAIADQSQGLNVRRVKEVTQDGVWLEIPSRPNGKPRFYEWHKIERWWRKV